MERIMPQMRSNTFKDYGNRMDKDNLENMFSELEFALP
jgi:hypothetical protein